MREEIRAQVGRCARIAGAVLAVLYLALLLCASMNAMPGTRDWMAGSEDLVWGRILSAQNEGLFSGDMFLRSWGEDRDRFLNNEAVESGQEEVYMAQSGLQGTCFAVIVKVMTAAGFSRRMIYKSLLILNCACFLIVFGLLCEWIRREIGMIAALGAFSCMFLAPKVVESIPHLYWVSWTMFLPTVIAAFWARSRFTGRNKKGGLYGIALFAAVLGRFMCGFEFTSTVMLSSEIPLLYYMIKEWKDRSARKRWFFLMFKVGLIELGAFVLAIGIWYAQIIAYMGGNFKDGMLYIEGQVAKRTGAFAGNVTVPEKYWASMAASRMSVVKNYLKSNEKLYMGMSLKRIIPLVAVSVFMRDRLVRESLRATLVRLLFLVACLLPAVSWFFLASGHSYIHGIVCRLLFAIPFLPIAVGMALKDSLEMVRILKNNARNLR